MIKSPIRLCLACACNTLPRLLGTAKCTSSSSNWHQHHNNNENEGPNSIGKYALLAAASAVIVSSKLKPSLLLNLHCSFKNVL